jgi:murein DD-endopeptidase MepM/ murein hydrolase activator NlpD
VLIAAVILALVPPVPGVVVRGFDYGADPFAGGQHRGVDFAVRPGAAVRAPCGGEVVAAGAVAGVHVVSLRCGRHRVSLLPLARVGVEAGARVHAGAVVGVAAGQAAHAGAPGRAAVHLGVRREGDPFGYVDPAALLAAPAPPPSPPIRTAPPLRPPLRGPTPSSAPPPAAPSPATPWPAFAGLALVLAGLTITAARDRRRRRELARSRAWSRASV